MKRRPQSEGYKCSWVSNYRCFPSLMVHLLGGKDRRSGLILSIPLSSDQTSMEELSATLDYLLSIPRYQRTETQNIPKTSHCFICLFMLKIIFFFFLKNLLDVFFNVPLHLFCEMASVSISCNVKYKQQRHTTVK